MLPRMVHDGVTVGTSPGVGGTTCGSIVTGGTGCARAVAVTSNVAWSTTGENAQADRISSTNTNAIYFFIVNPPVTNQRVVLSMRAQTSQSRQCWRTMSGAVS